MNKYETYLLKTIELQLNADGYMFTYCNKFVQTSLGLQSLECKITTGVLCYNYVNKNFSNSKKHNRCI